MSKLTAEQVRATPWLYSRAQFQYAVGASPPHIGEISQVQLARMSQAARRRYDATRRAEWDAAIAAGDEWRLSILAAHARGDLDGVELSTEARAEVRSDAVRVAKADTERAALERQRANNDVDKVAKGDRVWDVVARAYVEVVATFARSLRVSGARGVYTRPRYGFQRRSHGDLTAVAS